MNSNKQYISYTCSRALPAPISVFLHSFTLTDRHRAHVSLG